MQHEPIAKSIELFNEQQEQLPLIVEALAQAFKEGDEKIKRESIELLQQVLREDQIPQPIEQNLEKQVRRVNPINVLETLWDLQTNLVWLNQPTKRVAKIQVAFARYLTDTGIADYLPTNATAWYNEFAGYSDSTDLMKFFHRWYPYWLEVDFAIQDGLINSQYDAYEWMSRKRPQRFQWGKRTLRRWIALSSLPPIRRSFHDDPEYRTGIFVVKAQAFVRVLE